MIRETRLEIREVRPDEIDKLIELQAGHTDSATYFCVTREEFEESLAGGSERSSARPWDRVWGAYEVVDGAEQLIAFALVIANRETPERSLCEDVGKPFNEVITFDAVVVDERFRGRGLHREFLRLAEEFARKNGAKYIAATVAPENVFSRRNFEKAGFEVVAEKIKYNGVKRLIFFKGGTDPSLKKLK